MKRPLHLRLPMAWTLSLLLSSVSTSLAQLELVADVNPTIVFYNEYRTINGVGDKLFFATDNALWKSDGTPTGSEMIRSFSWVGESISINRLLIFAARDGKTGIELWRSDGTRNGTFMLKDINQGSEESSPALLTAVGNTLFFVATSERYGTELWKTNGERGATVLAYDVWPGPESGNPLSLAEFGGRLYFAADDGLIGNELRWINPTTSQKGLVKDIYPGSASGNPENLTSLGSWLYFSANTAEQGNELWKTNGTTAGTALVKDVWPGPESSYPSWLIDVSGTLFFLASDGVHGSEFWKSNGTGLATVLAFETYPGEASSFGDYPYGSDYGLDWLDIGTADGKLYFTPINRLFESDGTQEGTRFVANIADYGYYYGRLLFEAGGTIYVFVLDESDPDENGHRWHLARVENSELVTVKQLPRSTNMNLQLVETSLGMFFPFADETRNFRLWRTDGTSAGTYPIHDVSSATLPSYPSEIVSLNSNEIIFATDSLRRSDGTAEGTYSLPIWYCTGLTKAGDLVYCDGGMYLTGLVRTDGTSAGTQKLIQGEVSSLTEMNRAIYFGLNRVYPRVANLWKSDGTPEGTVLVTDAVNITSMYNHEGTLFIGSDGLWRSDGTAGRTVKIHSVTPGGAFRPFVSSGTKLYFTSHNENGGQQLWQTDGTSSGTRIILDFNRTFKDFREGPGGVLYLIAGQDPDAGLWHSNGITSTRLFPDGSIVHLLPIYNGLTYFVTIDQTRTVELWKTDGTLRGTMMVKSLRSGNLDYFVNKLDGAIYNDILYFGGTPNNIWRTDGTHAGTYQVEPRIGSVSAGQGLVATENALYFQARFPGVDAELGKLVTEGAKKGTKKSGLESIETNADGESPLAAYPNPFDQAISFSLSMQRDEAITAQIQSVDGRIVHKMSGVTNQTYTLDLKLRPGLYVLVVRVGARSYGRRIMRTR